MSRKTAAALEIIGVSLFYLLLACALTWPVINHLDEVLLGGGELGGWRWREWWHFTEVQALQNMNLGVIGTVEQLVGLGRYPETGNILDVLLFSYPLHKWFGFPANMNLKIILILLGNGLCAYAFARTLTDSYLVALAAGIIAIINPLVIQDINKLGLRQIVLWWLFLFPIALQRAGRTGRSFDGMLVGACFTLVAAFYWFYGLFAAMFGVIWVSWWCWKERPPYRHAMRWIMVAAATAIVGLFIFLLPYFAAEEGSSRGGVEQLPELTFFLDYPAYDTVSNAPLRPANYRDNVLSSLHRGIDSAWPADIVIDPRHGVKAFPVLFFFIGVLPAAFIPRARVWLLIWLIFWLGTMGPFLKIGAQKDTADVFMIGDYVFRMPYALMFKYIPGMSRMFAPYRLASVMVVAAVALVAIVMDRLRSEHRPYVAIVFIVASVLQPFYRFDLEELAANDAKPSMWRIPTQTSAMKIPKWYAELDPQGWEGIIELPLEQQQDLLCVYQSYHQRKVYRSWASIPAVPPWIRNSGGGKEGKRLRWLAKETSRNDRMEPVFRKLSRDPMSAENVEISQKNLKSLMESGNYRWLILHERGYYLVDPKNGGIMYRDVLRQMQEKLGIEAVELVEQQAFEWPGKRRNFPVGPAWIPWASQEVQKPVQDMPDRYFMAVFDLYSWNGWKEE